MWYRRRTRALRQRLLLGMELTLFGRAEHQKFLSRDSLCQSRITDQLPRAASFSQRLGANQFCVQQLAYAGAYVTASTC